MGKSKRWRLLARGWWEKSEREINIFAYKSLILGACRCSFTSTVVSNTHLFILKGTFLFLLIIQKKIKMSIWRLLFENVVSRSGYLHGLGVVNKVTFFWTIITQKLLPLPFLLQNKWRHFWRYWTKKKTFIAIYLQSETLCDSAQDSTLTKFFYKHIFFI